MYRPSRKRINERIEFFKAQIWRNRPAGTGNSIGELLTILSPEHIANTYEVTIVRMEELFIRDLHYEVGGLLDRSNRTIYLATKFGPEFEKFTALHEIGHYLCHPDVQMHRDSPIESPLSRHRSDSNDRGTEIEANWFAVGLLLSPMLVSRAFVDRFGVDLFIQTDESRYYLGEFENSLDLSRALVSSEMFGGRAFRSLKSQFGLSIDAMAYRLGEIGIVPQFGRVRHILEEPPFVNR